MTWSRFHPRNGGKVARRYVFGAVATPLGHGATAHLNPMMSDVSSLRLQQD
jgi:hypothetical protein